MGYLWLIFDRMFLTLDLKLPVCVIKKAINDLNLLRTALN